MNKVDVFRIKDSLFFSSLKQNSRKSNCIYINNPIYIVCVWMEQKISVEMVVPLSTRRMRMWSLCDNGFAYITFIHASAYHWKRCEIKTTTRSKYTCGPRQLRYSFFDFTKSELDFGENANFLTEVKTFQKNNHIYIVCVWTEQKISVKMVVPLSTRRMWEVCVITASHILRSCMRQYIIWKPAVK